MIAAINIGQRVNDQFFGTMFRIAVLKKSLLAQIEDLSPQGACRALCLGSVNR